MKDEFLTPEQIDKEKRKKFLKLFLSEMEQAMGKVSSPLTAKDISLKLVEENPVYDLETALKEIPNIVNQAYPVNTSLL